MKQPSFPGNDRRERSGNLPVALEVATRPNDHVHRHPGATERLVRKPAAAAFGGRVVRDDHEQVEITVRPRVREIQRDKPSRAGMRLPNASQFHRAMWSSTAALGCPGEFTANPVSHIGTQDS